MKSILATFTLLRISLFSFSQEVFLLNNIQNPMQFNPATTGVVYENRLNFESQTWLPYFDGTPLTFQSDYEKNIPCSRFGLGILLNSRYGYSTENYVEAHIRYNLIDKAKYRISLGTAIGYNHKKITFEPDTLWIDFEIDPTIPSASSTSFLYLPFGIWISTKNINAGISYYNYIKEWNTSVIDFSFIERFYAYVSYQHSFTENFSVTPEILFTNNTIVNYQFYGVNIDAYNFTIGITYRNDNSVIPSIGYNYKQFEVNANTMFTPQSNHFYI